MPIPESLLQSQRDIKQGLRERPRSKTWKQKAEDNPKSLKTAIAAKCWDCVCGDYNHASKHTIGTCQITDCPLWPHRPYQNIKSVLAESAKSAHSAIEL